MLLVQLGINSTRDVWKFAKLDSPRLLVQVWQSFQTSLVLRGRLHGAFSTLGLKFQPCLTKLYQNQTRDYMTIFSTQG